MGVDVAARRCIPSYQPHVSFPMEVLCGYSTPAPPSEDIVVNGSWLAIPDAGVSVGFDVDDGLAADAAWRPVSFMTCPQRKNST